MLKLYITARESNEDGTAVTLFEDYGLGYDDKDELLSDGIKDIRQHIFDKIEQVEKVNAQTATPF